MPTAKKSTARSPAKSGANKPPVVAQVSKQVAKASRPPAEQPKSDDTLARSLIAALPVAVGVLDHIRAIAALVPQLEAEMAKARKDGVVTLARAYVVLHRLTARAKEMLDVSDSGKVFGHLVERYAKFEIPEAFEQAGVPHVPLEEGFRVGVSVKFQASIVPDRKEDAYAWLRDNGLPDIITETVNASTLRLAPPLTVSNAEIDEAIALIKGVLA